ncbi:hypothetical protein Vretimale_2041, partial [Volvox reticuliferus]
TKHCLRKCIDVLQANSKSQQCWCPGGPKTHLQTKTLGLPRRWGTMLQRCRSGEKASNWHMSPSQLPKAPVPGSWGEGVAGVATVAAVAGDGLTARAVNPLIVCPKLPPRIAMAGDC